MIRILRMAAALLCAASLSAFASTSSMTATVTDTDGQTWGACAWSAVLSSPVPPTMSGTPVSQDQLRASGTCSASGVITATLLDTSSIDQKGAVWVFKVTPNASGASATVSVAVTGASPNLTANFSSVPAPRFPAGPKAYGYADIEVTNPALGDTYVNVGTTCGAASLRQYSNAGWQCGGSGGSSSGNLLGTPLADYLMDDGTGTTVTDSSGNGNNATLTAGRLPTWVQNGLQFTQGSQGVTLPSSLNTAKTFEIVACIDPMPSVNGQFKSNTNAVFISSSLGVSGVNFPYAGSGVGGLFSPGILSGGGNRDTVNDDFAGCHVLTFVLGTGSGDLDHIYIDGNETAYVLHGFSYGYQSSGNYNLGNPNAAGAFASAGIIGTVYRLRVLSNQLTAPQAKSDAVALLAYEANNGVSLSPPQYRSYQAVMNLIGDSITCAWNGTACNTSYSWGSQLTLTNQPTYSINNWGVYGAFMQVMAISEPWRVSPYCKTDAGPAIAINFGATNDLKGRTVAQVAQSAASIAQSMNAAGCVPFIMTVLSQSGNSTVPGTPTNDAQKDAYDALVVSQWKAWGYRGLIDVSNPLLQADGASANTTYFLDGVHPTATGQGLIATAASNALNYYFSGYSAGTPKVITTATTLASGDTFSTMGTLSGSTAITLPDCTGPTGAVYTIVNPQSAQTVTVQGASASQPVNGLTTAVTIPANSTAKLTIGANPKATSGCFWTM